VHYEQLLARHDDVRVIPTPDGADSEQRGGEQQDPAADGERPPRGEKPCAAERDDTRLRERTHEHDPVPARVEPDEFVSRRIHGFASFAARREIPGMGQTARRTAVATLVAGSIVVVALALWHLKLLLALVLFGFIIAAAMRPGVDWLARHGIPRPGGVAIHYVAFAGLIALFLWLVVPRAITQISQAVGNVDLRHATKHSTGIKHEFLLGLQKRLEKVPSGASLVHPAITVTKTAFEVLIGIFFMFATAAYWIFERERTMRLILSLVSRQRRRIVRDTWDLIDLKLGAFVRGELVLIAFVATLLSVVFWAIGEPYWILLGTFAGVFELVPVIGPLAAGAVAVGVGFTASWHVALGAGIAVLVVRLLEDYLIVPRVLGHAVGLSPLLVLISVTAVGLLLGGVYVLLAIPIAAVLATLVDVLVLEKDPADEEVPTVLFPAQDRETAG
jgi:predicted PurR-regulated permease PerM